MSSYMRVATAILVCLAAGSFTAFFISTDAGSWYDSLRKPPFMPPPWSFPFILIIQYALMACALCIMWLNDPHPRDFRGWVPLFFAHLLPNVAWTILFFGFHALFISLVDIFILTVAVFALMMSALERHKLAGYFLAPYFAWLCFVLLLNGYMWYMN